MPETNAVTQALIRASSNAGAIITESLANNKVFKHEVFTVSKRFPIGSEAVVNIGIDTTAFAKEFLVLLPFKITGFDAGPLNIDLRNNVSYTGGTEWVSMDRNFIDPVIPGVKWYHNPTISDEGILSPYQSFVPSNGAPGIVKVAGEVQDDFPVRLLPGIKYLIRITNTIANIGTGTFGASWFEI